MTDPLRDEVSALARGLSLLRAVAQAHEPLTHRALAEAVGIPKATVSRLAGTLVANGYLRLLSGERYALGSALLDLGNAFVRGFDFRQHARAHLVELADSVGANVHVGVRDGLDIVLIETVRPRNAVVLAGLEVGSRLSIAASAVGRAFLAALPLEERRELLARIKEGSGALWPQVESRLDAALAEHALLGYCSSLGEWHPEINSLGFTLRSARGELFGISVGGPAYKFPEDVMRERVAAKLLSTQGAIQRESGSQ
jgi:DNA-binding IclR family transcriptional regulator